MDRRESRVRPHETHLEGYWKYLSLAPQEQDTTSENDYLEIKLLSTESLRQALGSAPACPTRPRQQPGSRAASWGLPGAKRQHCTPENSNP